MTPQEAIPILKRLQEPEPWEPQISRDAYETLELAIEALEKQIPMKMTEVLDISGRPIRVAETVKMHPVAASFADGVVSGLRGDAEWTNRNIVCTAIQIQTAVFSLLMRTVVPTFGKKNLSDMNCAFR